MTRLLYLLFFCSGLSGLIYQVVWVRVFGNVFGNTIYSASIVVAVFMLGLGVGSYVVGAWADRRYLDQPESLVRVRILRAAHRRDGAWHLRAPAASRPPVGGGLLLLARRGRLVRALDDVVSGPRGNAILLLTPITMLMGGTLTLLIRHLVRSGRRARPTTNRRSLWRQHGGCGAGLFSDRLCARSGDGPAGDAMGRGVLQHRRGGRRAAPRRGHAIRMSRCCRGRRASCSSAGAAMATSPIASRRLP